MLYMFRKLKRLDSGNQALTPPPLSDLLETITQASRFGLQNGHFDQPAF